MPAQPSFFEEAVERPPRVIFGSGGTRSSPARLVRREEITEVCLLPVRDPFRIRLSTAVAQRRFVVCAIKAGVKIGPALVTLVSPTDKSLDLYLGATMMTVHTLQLLAADPSLFQYFTRVVEKNKASLYLQAEHHCFQNSQPFGK
jgi:hypothetical protein